MKGKCCVSHHRYRPTRDAGQSFWCTLEYPLLMKPKQTISQ